MLGLLGLHQENVDLDCVCHRSSYIKFHGTKWLMVDGRPISWESKHHGCPSPHKTDWRPFFGKRTRLHGRRFGRHVKIIWSQACAETSFDVDAIRESEAKVAHLGSLSTFWLGHPPIFHTQITMADKPNSWVAYIPFTAQDSQKASISWWLQYLWLKYSSIL